MQRGRILPSLLIACLVCAYPLTTQASDTMTNANTGPDSTNINNSNVTISITVNDTKHADVSQKLDFNINTGNNVIKNNTTVGAVKSGSITTAVAVENNVNIGSSSASSVNHTTTSTNTSTNVNTGPGSTNTNTSNTTTTTAVNVIKTATVNNAVSLALNTGGMVIDHNTRVGNVETGSVNATVKITNCVNTSVPCPKPITPPHPGPTVPPGGTTNPPTTVTTSGDKGGGIDMPTVRRPVTATLASVSSNAIPLTTLSAATKSTKGFFPAGANNNAFQYLLFLISSFALMRCFTSGKQFKPGARW